MFFILTVKNTKNNKDSQIIGVYQCYYQVKEELYYRRKNTNDEFIKFELFTKNVYFY